MTSETRPILIVGAGPTGLTAAMELSRLGVPVRIVDKRPSPSETSRALAVQARTLELFDQRGLTPEMLRLGNIATATALHGDGKLLGKIDLTQIQSRHHYILLLSQAETERLLREQVARQGVVIEHGTELIAFAQAESSTQPGAGGVKAVLRHAAGSLEELDAAFLVCAEGAHSLVRHTAGLAFEGKSLRETYVLADLHLDGDLPDGEISIFTTRQGLLAFFPLGNRRFRLIATDPEKHLKGSADPTLEEAQTLCDANLYVPVRLHDLVWSSRFWINSRMLHTLRSGRVFFGGDSAHIHSPAGGQGMNTGIQDMINLGWKLALVWRGKAAPELLDTYEQDRLPVIRDVLNRTEAATNAANARGGVVHELITHLAPVLLDLHFVQRIGTGVISEVTANYRSSPLAQTSGAHGGKLRAGDRVPDLDVVAHGDPQPRPTTLYACLDPSRFTLLATGNPDSSLEATLQPWQEILKTRWLDAPSGAEAAAPFHDLFGNGPGLLLVRPDAYVGFIGERATLPALVQWLERWLRVAAESK